LDEAHIGSAQLYYPVLTSTNRFAQILLSKTRPRAGTVITAAFQSAGKGQFGRSWFGSKGTNLCLSVILYPQIPATAQFTLSLFAALALRDTVDHFIDKQICVKWPNDIYVEDRKIGGILIQNSISGQTIQHAIIGIGLNVNEITFPASLPNPTSLAMESGYKFDLNNILQKLMEFLNKWHERAHNLPLEILKKQYTNHMYQLGEVCLFHVVEHDKTEEARLLGVDDSGRLLLEFSDVGLVKTFSLDQIRHVIT